MNNEEEEEWSREHMDIELLDRENEIVLEEKTTVPGFNHLNKAGEYAFRSDDNEVEKEDGI